MMMALFNPLKKEKALGRITEAVQGLKARSAKSKITAWPRGLASPWANKQVLPHRILDLLLEYVDRKASTPAVAKKRLKALNDAFFNLGASEHDLLEKHLKAHQGTRKPVPWKILVHQVQGACTEALQDPALSMGGVHRVPDSENQSPEDWLLYMLGRIFLEHENLPSMGGETEDPATRFELFIMRVLRALSLIGTGRQAPTLRRLRTSFKKRVRSKIIAEMSITALVAMDRGPDDTELDEIVKVAGLVAATKAPPRKPGRPRKKN